jgi:hypothetical protein
VVRRRAAWSASGGASAEHSQSIELGGCRGNGLWAASIDLIAFKFALEPIRMRSA